MVDLKILVLGYYSKGKIGWFIRPRLVFETFMLYEKFERLMFGDSCLTIYPYLEDMVYFVQVFLASILSSQDRFDGFVAWVFSLLLFADKDRD